MQLTYRGIAYQSEDRSLQAQEGKIIGHYRGLPSQICMAETVPDQAATLRYRGLFYLRGR